MRKVIFFALLIQMSLANALDQKEIQANPSCVMGDKFIGTIVQSSEKADIGKNITFIGLNGNQPELLLESGVKFSYKKLFENKRTLSLVLARESERGAIDSFVIDKQTGKFSRVSAGLVTLPGEGVYSIASLGVCK
jgi:hypothetical protein